MAAFNIGDITYSRIVRLPLNISTVNSIPATRSGSTLLLVNCVFCKLNFRFVIRRHVFGLGHISSYLRYNPFKMSILSSVIRGKSNGCHDLSFPLLSQFRVNISLILLTLNYRLHSEFYLVVLSGGFLVHAKPQLKAIFC